MEVPNVPPSLAILPTQLRENVTYFVGRETFENINLGLMGAWQETIFGFLVRNSRDVSLYFNLPLERVAEVGGRLDL